MASNALRTQYPYGGDALSPRPLYDFPSPTSNYPSGVGATSPGFYPMAYNISPRFGGSAFIPSAEVFNDGRKGSQGNALYSPRDMRARISEGLNNDPVAMHLLVETAMIDSKNFDIISVEEVEALKQEQKGLDSRLSAVRKRLETETKLRDAAQSLNRLTAKKYKGHQRGIGSRGSNAIRDTLSKSGDELLASNRKVEDLTRDLLEIEARMRLIDMQLLMHTAAVLQLTHNGPTKRKQNAQMENGGDRRPDSPASIYTYENDRNEGARDNGFDERSLYRSPENLDSLMNALQNGTHHHVESMGQQNEALTSVGKRLEDLNGRLRELIVQANPERNEKYSLPPRIPPGKPDSSAVDRQLDFLDQGLRDINAEHGNRQNSMGSMHEVEERLEGINNQLYALLSRTEEKSAPPPPITSNGFQEQLNYLEDSFYNVQQLHYSMSEEVDNLRSKPASNDGVERYETTLMGLWQIIQAGEEEARERKRERRRLLAEDPDNTEELSPDEDYNPNEQFSLPAFSAKVQLLFSRATSLKDKQAILIRQIKQQRELNSKSDAQKEAEFGKLNERILSARSANKSMESELERAMSQLKQFDEQKIQSDSQALRDAQERSASLENQLREVQERSVSSENQLRDAQSRSTTYEAQVRDAQARLATLESQLKEAQDKSRVEASAIQTELSQSTNKIEEATTALRAATAAREDAEARSMEAANALNAKEEELRNLEGEVVRLTTELTFAKAELDGAYGTRAERAAESGAKNANIDAQLEALQKISEAASKSEVEARESERNLKAELAGMATEYEALTRDAIQNEKDRDTLEASIDKLRDEKEALELELSDERVKWLGIRSPSVAAGATNGAAPMSPDAGATSIRMLREDFRKMMRERTAEGLRALRAEQEERRKLEATVRQMRKDASPAKSNLSKTMTA